jgi:hypothetical protein
MSALVIFGLRLLRLAVYVEAAVIVALLVVACWMCVEIDRWYELGQSVRAERDEARSTLDALRRMSEIRSEAALRMAHMVDRSGRR